MKEYQVSYWMGKMYFAYIIEAKDEADAKRRVIKQSYHPELITGFKAERHYRQWN